MQDKGLEIADYIIEVYNMFDEKGHNKDAQKMRANAKEFEIAFEGYYIDDIKQNICEYYRYKSDKTRPTIAQLLAFIKGGKTESSIFKKNVIEKPLCLMYKYQDIYEKFIEFAHCEGYISSPYFASQGFIEGCDKILVDGIPSKKHYIWQKRVRDCRRDLPNLFADADNFQMPVGHKTKLEMAIAHNAGYF